MCRLLGYVAAHPISVFDVLGEEALETFTSLTAVHGDGWGMAWQEPGGLTTRSASAPDSAALDATYADLVRQPLGAAGFVHLRWATGGLPVTAENTHPFTEGGYAFAHNGHVAPLDHLESLLTQPQRQRLVGDTDSERYFRFIMQFIAECGDEQLGVQRALGLLLREFPNSSLNALLLTPTRMFAVHINSRADSPLRALRDMFDTEDEIPARHATEYFAMDYRITSDAVHVTSSGLDEPGWSRVPDDTAVMVDLATRQLTPLELFATAP